MNIGSLSQGNTQSFFKYLGLHVQAIRPYFDEKKITLVEIPPLSNNNDKKIHGFDFLLSGQSCFITSTVKPQELEL